MSMMQFYTNENGQLAGPANRLFFPDRTTVNIADPATHSIASDHGWQVYDSAEQAREALGVVEQEHAE